MVIIYPVDSTIQHLNNQGQKIITWVRKKEIEKLGHKFTFFLTLPKEIFLVQWYLRQATINTDTHSIPLYTPIFTCKFSILISIHFSKDIFPLVIRVLNKSWRLAKFTAYFTWTCCILFFGNYPFKSQKLIMSVFCSNTLIFSPECWKCTLRGTDFKIFSGGKT